MLGFLFGVTPGLQIRQVCDSHIRTRGDENSHQVHAQALLKDPYPSLTRCFVAA